MVKTVNIQAQIWPPADMNGNGSIDSPWEIVTADHLAALATYVNAGNGDSTANKYYILMNDIDLADWAATPGDTYGCIPIGDNSTSDKTTRFQGNFDGNGKVIHNLTANRTYYVGLFGCIDNATIQNLGIENCNITGNQRIGGLVGQIIYNSTVNNCYATGNINGNFCAGGLVGYSYRSTITNSYAGSNVNTSTSSVGGLVGTNEEYSSIINCYATGNVTSRYYASGLVGFNYVATISNCYTTSDLMAEDYVGGLAAMNTNSVIQNSVAANKTIINLTSNSNRIVGLDFNPYNMFDDNIYRNNYAYNGMILIEDGDTTILTNDDYDLNGTGMCLDTLKTLEFYNTGNYWYLNEPWDINPVTGEIWQICNQITFPFLRWQENFVCPFIITATAGNNGSISPSGIVIVDAGEDQLFTFTPATGFHIDSIFIDGIYNAAAVAANSYTFVNVTENHTIHVTFAINTYTITATVSANGTIFPSGEVILNHGESITFTFAANDGSEIGRLLIDGYPVFDSIEKGRYSFYNITANHTIYVDFRVGIAENEMENAITLYPNPATHQVELRIENNKLKVSNIEIYDVYGKLLQMIPVTSPTILIDVNMYNSGVYLIRLYTENGELTKKLIKS